MPDFNPSDVAKVAQAVLEGNPYYEDCGTNWGYVCEHCSGHSYKIESFRHSSDCPVLVAQDILTGYPWNGEKS